MSTNISKQKRKDLTDKIKAVHKYIASAKQDENTRNMLAWLSEIEKEINARKFGLVFEEHREAIDETLETHTPVLTENKKLFIDNGGQVNFLIEGDNLAALQLLLKTYKGKIKMIYIDPPYNTRNKDFTYDDNIVEKTDTFIHSKWLSFLRIRLFYAQMLLKSDGILFISIDDNEQAYLKLLCDEIFGEENFYTQIIIQSNKRGQTYKQIAKTHEYLLVYTKSPSSEFNEIEKTAENHDLNFSDCISPFNIRELRNRNPKFGRFNRPNLYYPIYVNSKITDKDGFSPISLTKSKDFTIEVFPLNSKNEDSCWRWGKPLAQRNMNINTLNSNLVAKITRGNKYNIYEKYRKTTYKSKTIWFDNDVITERGTVELGELGLSDLFEFPKPLGLIDKCLQIGTKDNDIILDFFAGSGTTGQAVIMRNMVDDGGRRFILCTNNENNICRNVTYERLKRFLVEEEFNSSLKYYKIDYIPISDRLYYEYADELLGHIRELVELENGISFSGNDKIAIVLTEAELDDFVKNIKKHKNCRKLYRAHNVLVSAEQAAKLKTARIKVNVIPDYYYGELET
jgi:adenine-specific DNA-methyltransferase